MADARAMQAEIERLRAHLAEVETELTKAYAEGLDYSCRAVAAEAKLRGILNVIGRAEDGDEYCVWLDEIFRLINSRAALAGES